MKLSIKIENKDKIYQENRILTDNEIKFCVSGVNNLLHQTLEDMQNKILKNLLDDFAECGPSEAENK